MNIFLKYALFVIVTRSYAAAHTHDGVTNSIHSSQPAVLQTKVPPPHLNSAGLKSTNSKGNNSISLPEPAITFERMRRVNQVYVDKTNFLMELLKHEGFYLFRRPRRFGKTLLVNTMKSFFKGEKELFNNTAIYNRGNTRRENGIWMEYPVISMNFGNLTDSALDIDGSSTVNMKLRAFKQKLHKALVFIAQSYGVDHKESLFTISDLICTLYLKFKLPVVILIDEYDEPVTYARYTVKNDEFLRGIIDIISRFLMAIKSNGHILRLVWVTGITKLGFSLIGSGPNCFHDVTFDENFASAAGFTKNEIETYFDPHIQEFSIRKKLTRQEIMDSLTRWYDGYHFSPTDEERSKNAVFNPISVIQCLKKKEFGNYWCQTESIKYIIHVLYSKNYTVDDFKHVEISLPYLEEAPHMSNPEPPIEVFMLLNGYLTIEHYDTETKRITVNYPNKEIEDTLRLKLLTYIPSEDKFFEDMSDWIDNIKIALNTFDIPTVVDYLDRTVFRVKEGKLGSDKKIQEPELTRRLGTFFDVLSVRHKDTTDFAIDGIKDGDIDMQTLELPINYMIEVKCGEGAEKGILQLLGYVSNHTVSFRQGFNNQDKVYLWCMNFTQREGGRLDSWIAIPYFSEKLIWEEAQAASENLLKRVRSKYRMKKKNTTASTQ